MRSIFGLERVTHDRAPVRIARGQFAFGHERQARLRPRVMAAEKNFSRRCPGVTQPARNALAYLLTILANNDR